MKKLEVMSKRNTKVVYVEMNGVWVPVLEVPAHWDVSDETLRNAVAFCGL